jgi:hypothetical protein
VRAAIDEHAWQSSLIAPDDESFAKALDAYRLISS